jgi:uncharacterized protein YhbP (UPF0306 family)
MAIERSKRRFAAARISRTARALLDSSTLCAIATVGSGGRAHINMAYFASSPEFDLVWLSDPRAIHSRNIRANGTVAVGVYDSNQTWGSPDRGIQLFGTARELHGAYADDAESLYAERFTDFRRTDFGAYRFYLFRPRRLKVFDERELGEGTFVSARIGRERQLAWERTDIYRQGTTNIRS